MRLRKRCVSSVPLAIALALAASAIVFIPVPLEGAEKVTTSESVSGSLPGYQTTVERESKGELNEENLRQISLLASQTLMHLNHATDRLEEDDVKQARDQAAKALELIRLIRAMLPVTIETTVVRDANGKEVYRHSETVQDEVIPIYEQMTAVEVLQPILAAKRDRAEVEGVRLADVELIHTSVVADLGYIERKLKRATARMDREPAEARVDLLRAQVDGVRVSSNHEQSPLVETLRALRLAERMAEEKNLAAAEANLELARNRLALYRGAVPKEEQGRVAKLEKELADVESRIRGGQESAGLIRGFWTRVASWMSSELGQATATSEDRTS